MAKQLLKKAWRKTKRWALAGLTGLVLATLNASHTGYPVLTSDTQRNLYENYGVVVKGPEESIAASTDALEEVLAEKQATGTLDVSTIRIIPEENSQRRPLDRFLQWFTNDAKGYYNPLAHAVHVRAGPSTQLLRHELAHATTFYDLLDRSLREEWVRRASDEDGTPLYKTLPGQLATYSPKMERWASEQDTAVDDIHYEKGFPSRYAHTNVIEHAAEITEEIEAVSLGNSMWMETENGRWFVERLQEMGAIGEHTLAYSAIMRMPIGGARTHSHPAVNYHSLEELEEATTRFLGKDPRPYLRSRALQNLGAKHSFYTTTMGVRGSRDPQTGIPFLEQALRTHFEENHTKAVLNDLRLASRYAQNEEKLCLYGTLHHRLYREGDYHASEEGFLAALEELQADMPVRGEPDVHCTFPSVY